MLCSPATAVHTLLVVNAHGLLLIFFRCGTIEDGAREQVQHRDLQALLFSVGVHFYGSSPFSQEIGIKQYMAEFICLDDL